MSGSGGDDDDDDNDDDEIDYNTIMKGKGVPLCYLIIDRPVPLRDRVFKHWPISIHDFKS